MIKNHIKVLRAARDMTQDELAERLGVSRQSIISIEGYKYKPSLELAFKIAAEFGLGIDDVFTWTPDEPHGTRKKQERSKK